MWAVKTQERLIKVKRQQLLNQEDELILGRCTSYLKNLNDTNIENYTLTVLANEGFLPGYGLYDTGIKAFAHRTFLGYGRVKADFELSRPPIVALREFIPGNMIYANSGKFKVVLFRFPIQNEELNLRNFSVDLDNNCILDEHTGVGEVSYSSSNIIHVSSVPVSDVDIHLTSRINDEEANRFQLSVNTIAQLQRTRSGGRLFMCNGKDIQLLYGQKLLLINLGPADRMRLLNAGYPICSVCGAARSPYSSQTELKDFKELHRRRCGKEPGEYALTAEDSVDGFFIKGFVKKEDAYNLGEALLVGATRLLEMERNDLCLNIIGESDGSTSLFIYDTMPGGSGILNQIADNWLNVCNAAKDAVENCPNKCESSCYDCLRTYNNTYYQKSLDRKKALLLVEEYRYELVFERKIIATDDSQYISDHGLPTNKHEKTFGEWLETEGFPQFIQQKNIVIGPPFNNTIPDYYYEDEIKETKVAIYLNGLSRGIHGNEERARIDTLIRQRLSINSITVIEVSDSTLNDPEQLKLKFAEIAAALKLRELKDKYFNY